MSRKAVRVTRALAPVRQLFEQDNVPVPEPPPPSSCPFDNKSLFYANDAILSLGHLSLCSNNGLALQTPCLSISKCTVTQEDDTDNVEVDSVAGVITTAALSTAPGATTSFRVVNASVCPTSLILTSFLYSATLGDHGFPLLSLNAIKDGSFVINITNTHATEALAGFLKIHFLIA